MKSANLNIHEISFYLTSQKLISTNLSIHEFKYPRNILLPHTTKIDIHEIKYPRNILLPQTTKLISTNLDEFTVCIRFEMIDSRTVHVRKHKFQFYFKYISNRNL
jgi:hypothetical protein